MMFAAGLSFALNLGLTTIMHEWLMISEEVSFLVALILVTTTNFFLSRHFVYQASSGSIGKQFKNFILSIIGFRAGEYLAYLMLVSYLDVQYQLAIAAVLVISFILKYLFFGRYVFTEGPVP